jgi:hypothetical protein
LRLTSPRMVGPDVVTLQNRLGIGADGVFGLAPMAPSSPAETYWAHAGGVGG